MEELMYPIGRYPGPGEYDHKNIQEWIDTIEQFPEELKELVVDLNAQQLETPYRPDGWTIRQVVHHVVDSHMNAYIRFKRAITEDCPTISPYNQTEWAELPDGKNGDIQVSLDLLTALHHRWSLFLNSLLDTAFERTYQHPEHPENSKLVYLLGLYAWHCNHHYAHIGNLILREDW